MLLLLYTNNVSDWRTPAIVL